MDLKMLRSSYFIEKHCSMYFCLNNSRNSIENWLTSIDIQRLHYAVIKCVENSTIFVDIGNSLLLRHCCA